MHSRKIIGIAINEYDDAVLNNIDNCVNDLNRIIGVFSSRYEFNDIELLSRRDQTTYKFLYNILYNELINALPGDNILIIYAGHGEFNPTLKTSYWQPSDAEHNDASTWFSMDILLSFINASPAGHIALISDSCFSGTIFEPGSRGGGTAAFEGKKSRQALTSGSNEKVSDGTRDSLSPFAQTLVQLLEKNDQPELPFAVLGNQLLQSFDPKRKQTPMFGALVNTGHEGGSLILLLKPLEQAEKKAITYNQVNVPLNMPAVYDLSYECTIPFFEENGYFDNQFINTFIQHTAFNVISGVRSLLHEDREFFMERNKEIGFELRINSEITLMTGNCVSMAILVYDYFGGAHPNYRTHTLNFAFSPDRTFSLSDLIDYSGYQNLDDFVKAMIKEYGEPGEDIQDTLLSCLDDYSAYRLGFNIYPDKLMINMDNQLPHAFKAAGYIEIPRSKLKFKFNVD